MTPRPALDIRPLARDDIAEAAGWYEDRVAGLGARFLARVGDALRSAHESPERYRLIYRDVRRVSVPDFPYAVYFVVRGDRVHVVGCMHGRRHPSRWQGRARDL